MHLKRLKSDGCWGIYEFIYTYTYVCIGVCLLIATKIK